MLLPLFTTFEAKWFGPGDSIRHGCVSQDKDNTLGRREARLVSVGGEQNKLTRVHLKR